MTTVSKGFSPSDIFQGPADAWLGIGAPASAVPPVEYTNTLQLNSAGEPADSNTTGGILTGTVGTTGSGGSGYVVGDYVSVTQTGAVNGILRVKTVSTGAILTFDVIRPGTGYSVANNLVIVTITGVGTGATGRVLTIEAAVNLGLTDGPASTNINPKFNEIMSDNFAAPVDVAFVSQACEIDIIVKQTNLRRIQRYFAGLNTGAYFDLLAGSTNPACDLLQIGSSRSSASQVSTLMLIAPRRDSATGWMYMLAYRAYLAGSIAPIFDRKKETTYKLKFKCLADTSRAATDQVLQIVRY